MSHPFTDIVIPVHGALTDLRECVDTLKINTVDYRLIFVDDASDRETSNYLYDVCLENPSWLIVRTSRQRWFTRASNLGLKLVRTERSVLLNSDCVLDKGWLEELFGVWDECQAQNPQRKVGLVGSVMSMEDPRRYEDVVRPDYVTGHCWLVSVSALFEISMARGMPGWYLDETKPQSAHICSDRDGCWEMQQLGFATLRSYKSAVGHKGGRSWGYNLGAIPRNPGAVDLDMNR